MITFFLHAQILHPGHYKPEIRLRCTRASKTSQESMTLSMTFDRPNIPLTYTSGLLGGLILILQNAPKNTPLLICTSADYLLRMLVTEREKYENDLLNPLFPLIKSTIALLNERVAHTQFSKVSENPAKLLEGEPVQEVEINTEIDLMFESPGMLLSRGSQRIFTKIIRSMCLAPHRKSTFINLDRIRCSVEEISGYTPSDTMIWTSIRSSSIQRLS